MTMAWYVARPHPSQAIIAQDALGKIMTTGAIVPALWFFEVANALLMTERHRAAISGILAGTPGRFCRPPHLFRRRASVDQPGQSDLPRPHSQSHRLPRHLSRTRPPPAHSSGHLRSGSRPGCQFGGRPRHWRQLNRQRTSLPPFPNSPSHESSAPFCSLADTNPLTKT